MSQSQDRSFNNIQSRGKKPADNSMLVLNVIGRQKLTFEINELFFAYFKDNVRQIYDSINVMQDYVFRVYNKQKKFEKKENIYTEANKKF